MPETTVDIEALYASLDCKEADKETELASAGVVARNHAVDIYAYGAWFLNPTLTHCDSNPVARNAAGEVFAAE